jgi:hypothetical protein
MPKNFIAWRYRADDGTDYQTKADKRYTDQQTGGGAVKLGGDALVTGLKPLPKTIIPRKRRFSDSTYSGSLVVYEPTAPAAVDNATVMDLFDGLGATHAALPARKLVSQKDKSRGVDTGLLS